jgi:GTP-binding protein
MRADGPAGMDAAEEAREAERVRKLFAGPCDFVAGAAKVEMIPPDSLPEFAFVGRSNVGKSSLINALTGRNALARVSQTPGRTRQINFFDLGGQLMLVDLPGYGYAKISKQMAAEWQHLISRYLRGRAGLRRVVLLIDARRGIKDVDREVMTMLDQAAVSYVITLTKIDTLKGAEREAAIARVTGQIAGHTAAYPEILVTSAETREGVEPLRRQLAALVAS